MEANLAWLVFACLAGIKSHTTWRDKHQGKSYATLASITLPSRNQKVLHHVYVMLCKCTEKKSYVFTNHTNNT